ncbi:hypothetical protein BSLG_000348 [Batrachochytrium salamandrivorans]|nr:hypothetical protein BSLG_000348 [Batrachochytrium salamandrivorans]
MVGKQVRGRGAHKTGHSRPSSNNSGNRSHSSKNSHRDDTYDVYQEVDSDEDARKLLARRGGGGGAVGRTLDDVGTLDFAVNEVDEDDDEELDDDEAFNSSDEERYGIFFSSKKTEKASRSAKKATPTGELDLNEESDKDESNADSDEDEEEEEGGDYMDISDLLNKDTSLNIKSVSKDATKDSKDLQKSSKQRLKKSSSGISLLLPSDTDSDDDSSKNSDFSDLQEILDAESDAPTDEDPEDMTKLSTVIQSMSRSKQDPLRKRKRLPEVTEAFEESEFGLEAKSQDQTLHARKKLGYKTSLTGGIHRGKKEVSKWTAVVKKNREADTLSFPMNLPQMDNISSGALIGKFAPVTDLEKEIEQMLQQSGLTERKQKQMEELELNKISQEELIERRRELAKMRSVMFYQEQKQKRISKIKSKAYRKIHKKKNTDGELSLEELNGLDPDLAQEKIEKMELARAKERMTLKHKNMGKWAKEMLSKNDMDPESRQALMHQLQKHDELKRRIRGAGSDESDGNDDLMLDGNGNGYGDDPASARQDGLNSLDAMSAEMDGEEQLSGKGLLAMKFMQRGLARQKEEARQSLLRAKKSLLRQETGGNKSDGSQFESDDDDEDMTNSNNVGEYSGRMVFGASSLASNAGALDFDDDEDASFTMDADMNSHHVRASGPVNVDFKPLKLKAEDNSLGSIAGQKAISATSVATQEPSQKPLFQVKSFDIEDEEDIAFIGNANKTKVEPLRAVAAPAAIAAIVADHPTKLSNNKKFKATKPVVDDGTATQGRAFDDHNDPSLGKEDAGAENPWLAGASDGTVQKHLSGASSREHKLSKADKALAKLSREVKASRRDDNAPTNDQELLELELGGLDGGHQEKTVASHNAAVPDVQVPPQKDVPKPAKADYIDESEDDSDVEMTSSRHARPAMVHSVHANALAQVDLIRMAFANDDVLADFEGEKRRIMQDDAPAAAPAEVPGWGSWAGPGLVAKDGERAGKVSNKGAKEGSKNKGGNAKTAGSIQPSGPRRADSKLQHVMISTKKMKKISKYMLPDVPQGFETGEQYEKMIQMPLGREWNSQSAHSKLVLPRVQTKLGMAIQPLKLPSSKGTTNSKTNKRKSIK